MRCSFCKPKWVWWVSMVEFDSVSPTWLRAVMVETWQVKEEGNWVCLEDANVKVGEFLGRAKEGVSKGRGELERFRTELVPEFVSRNWWERWKVIMYFETLCFNFCLVDKKLQEKDRKWTSLSIFFWTIGALYISWF